MLAPAQPALRGLGQPEYSQVTPEEEPFQAHAAPLATGLSILVPPGAGFHPLPVSHGNVDLMGGGAQLPEDVRESTLLPLVLARPSLRNFRGLL